MKEEQCSGCNSWLFNGESCDRCEWRVTAAAGSQLAPKYFKWPKRDPETGDAELSGYTCGGCLDDVPLPHIWKYASGRYLRPVRVTVTRYPSHPHFYVTMKEEDDSVWDSKENRWRTPRSQSGGHERPPWCGNVIENDHKYVKAHFVKAFVDKMVGKYFPETSHRIEYESLGSAMLYSKDGD